MLEHLTPDDKEEDYTDLHKLARAQALEPADTNDDVDFTVEETRNAVASMGKRKAPGEDGITVEVYKSAFEVFPIYIKLQCTTAACEGVFPKRCKTANLVPTVKPGKENTDDVSKFRPVSLPITRGKVLEKLLINEQ